MRLSSFLVVATTMACAAALAVVAASFAATAIEDRTEIAVRRSLDSRDMGWAEVQANGLQVILSGTAESEAERFRVVSLVGTLVDAARVVDAMSVKAQADLAPPRFSVEILRNEAGLSVIGLIPSTADRDGLMTRLAGLVGDLPVTDLLETADYPQPDGWTDAMAFAEEALERLPRSKISVHAGQVDVTAIADSSEAKADMEAALNRAAPAGLRLALDIAAPRPVITPFTLRFLIDSTGARFDACSADTDAAATRIVAAAVAAGMPDGVISCTVGMGVPSPNWSNAAETAIAALADLGRGSVTFADADVTLVAAQGTDEALFDRVVGELDAALPEVFALQAVLPEPATEQDIGPSEFVATLSPEGLVQLRGRLTDESLRIMADSYARAAFGSDRVYTATRVVDGMPPDWAARVLAGLEALSRLTHGAVLVEPANLTVRGETQTEDAKAQISGLLAEQLGQGQLYTLDITYRPPPEPITAPPTPEDCEAQLAQTQAASKITFEPGSATITASSERTMNAIAEILKLCGPIRLEIQGHTDSQGRESMNQELSQARAQSVLNELRARRVLTGTYVARGYGEARPIEDNKTEEGREANRRIEFWLIRPKPTVETVTTLESIEAEAATTQPAQAEETPNEPQN